MISSQRLGAISVRSDLSGKLSWWNWSLQHSNEVIIWTQTDSVTFQSRARSIDWLLHTIRAAANSPVTFENSSIICSFVLLLGMEPTNSLLLATEMQTPMCLPGRISLLLHWRENGGEKKNFIYYSKTKDWNNVLLCVGCAKWRKKQSGVHLFLLWIHHNRTNFTACCAASLVQKVTKA